MPPRAIFLSMLVLLLLPLQPAHADEAPGVQASVASGGAWPLPEPDSCNPKGGLRTGLRTHAEDAPPALPFAPGDVFGLEAVDVLRSFLPDFLWPYRDRFFFEGMRLEIGPCFRDFHPPAFYRQATEKNRGEAQLRPDGGIEGYRAGQPFPAEDLDPRDPRAGDKWLWNVEFRYQAGGFRGPFRMTDLVGRIGRAEPEGFSSSPSTPGRTRGGSFATWRTSAIPGARTTSMPISRSGAACAGSTRTRSRASTCPPSRWAWSRTSRSPWVAEPVSPAARGRPAA